MHITEKRQSRWNNSSKFASFMNTLLCVAEQFGKSKNYFQNVFPRYGYIQSPFLDTNAFFVPSLMAQECLDMIRPGFRGLLDIFSKGDRVEFEAVPQSERSGCRWMAKQVQGVAERHCHLMLLVERMTDRPSSCRFDSLNTTSALIPLQISSSTLPGQSRQILKK